MVIRVFDNKGKGFDRYSVFVDRECFSMSENPLSLQGFNQTYGFSINPNDVEDRKMLGEEIRIWDLNKQVKEAIYKNE